MNSEKLRYALENGIPVVSPSWLWDCIRSSTYLPYHSYGISGSRQSQTATQPTFFHPRRNPRPHKVEAKPARSYDRNQKHGQLDLSYEVKHKGRSESRSLEHGELTLRNESQISVRALQNLPPTKTNSQTRSSRSPSKKVPDEPAQPLTTLIATDDRQSIPIDQSAVTEISVAPNDSAMVSPDSGPLNQEQPSFSLNSTIATLIAHKQKANSSRPSSATTVSTIEVPRRHRPLGRAPSNGTPGLGTLGNSSEHPEGRQSGKERGDRETPMADDEFDLPPQHGGDQELFKKGFAPSQALSYEDPEGAAVRERLMRRARGGGGEWDEDAKGGPERGGWDADGERRMTRVEGIGRVTDSRAGAAEDSGRRRVMRKR